MPWGLKRYQQTGNIHFVTFSCYHREALLGDPQARDTFVMTLERARRWYGFHVTGFVVMPEHVHLLLSEPERSNLAVALQMLKQIVSQELNEHSTNPFWQSRYYDFNVYRQQKLTEKLDYMHQNPVQRGLVRRPEDWKWSSARHYATGAECGVEIESHWTARRREQLGIYPVVRRRDVGSKAPPSRSEREKGRAPGAGFEQSHPMLVSCMRHKSIGCRCTVVAAALPKADILNLEDYNMHQGYRCLTSFFLAAALASPVAIAQQDDQRRGDDQRQQQDENHRNTENQNRVYDRGHKDYHNWDDNENRAWGQYQTEHHRTSQEFSKANNKEQSEYWNWRHAHPDKD